MLSIVPVYAALLALGFIFLSVRVIRYRRVTRTSLGSGGSVPLERAIRVQGNFAEYVPLALIVLAFVEAGGWHELVVHGLAASLLAGRALHAYGVGRENEDFRFRVAGMAVTLTVLGTGALLVLLERMLRSGGS